jgi:hypothetical protein
MVSDAQCTRSWIHGLWIALLITGCGKSDASVTGQVLRNDGTPAAGVAVTARSDDTGKWASGITDANGQYVLRSPSGEPLPPGDYYVTIAEETGAGFDADQQAERTIPSKYELPSTSGLRVTIESDKPTVFNVNLDPL